MYLAWTTPGQSPLSCHALNCSSNHTILCSGFDGDECISLLYRYRALSIIPPELQDRLIPTPDDSETLESITGFKAPLLQAYTLLFMASRVVTENTTIRLNGHFRRISNASKFYTEKAVSVIKQIRPTVLRDSVEKFLRKSLLVLFHGE